MPTGRRSELERREAIARSREALQTLKPQELRALTLLAEGYSYVEIGEITGYSATKINRCLAEGRERFRSLVSRSEDGRRCAEMRPLLSAFCDGETSAPEAAQLREHLRACTGCRATLRTYRAAPGAAAALAPALPLSRSLLERAHDAVVGVTSRFGGGGSGDAALSQVAAAGGGSGAGMAALAKVAAICVGTAGGAAACVAAGVVPAPLPVDRSQAQAPKLERQLNPRLAAEWSEESGVDYEPAPAPEPVAPEPEPEHADSSPQPSAQEQPQVTSAPAAPSGAVEYSPPAPAPAPVTSSSAPSSGGGNPSGEFGP